MRVEIELSSWFGSGNLIFALISFSMRIEIDFAWIERINSNWNWINFSGRAAALIFFSIEKKAMRKNQWGVRIEKKSMRIEIELSPRRAGGPIELKLILRPTL